MLQHVSDKMKRDWLERVRREIATLTKLRDDLERELADDDTNAPPIAERAPDHLRTTTNG